MIRNNLVATRQDRAATSQEPAQKTSQEVSAQKSAQRIQDSFEQVPSWYARPWENESKLQYGLDPAVRAKRNKAGIEAHHTEHVHESPLEKVPSYFRTFDQIKEKLAELATRFPDLVEVDDVGDSSEKTRGEADRDLLRIRVTNKNSKHTEAQKPKTLWTGGYHSREIANPQLLLQWLETVLENYGTDPEATALLDSRVLDVIPMVNPDGHVQVEKSYFGPGRGNRMQRKNTSGRGTDLNRNHTFGWGGPGASSWPSSQTYRGPEAASEPETQGVEKTIRETDYTMTIDWHSYSELVLYPWGHTREKAPDHEGLKAIAERFASFNGYTPQQSVELYPTSGTSDGPGYGEKRIPAFVIETGRSFHQSDSEFERTKGETWPVMTYAAKIADKPYERAKGPDMAQVKVDAETGALTATAISGVDAETVQGIRPRNTMVEVEYVLDPLTPAGEGVSLTATDGAMDDAAELMSADVADLIKDAKPGTLIHVRGRDSDGNWGPLTAQWLVPPAIAAARKAA